MNSDSDSDREIPNYDTTNEQSDNFRRVISQWKQKQLETLIGDDQDTLKLNAYLKKASEAYTDMKAYIEENKKKTTIDKVLLEALGDPTSFSTDTRINILHTLFRDLVEFPFTYDTTLINSFDGEEVLDTEIVGNK